jgi:pentatricopeptide repeat protein
MRRAAICIGVNRVQGMTELRAAADGARQFEAWARGQGCDTRLLVDDEAPVAAADVFAAVKERVDAGVYGQLVVYFSGHGILLNPGSEYWLLSGAPANPNEAVNLLRSVEDARNSGIPHVVFVSDACRSSVSGPPLNGITGQLIFPYRAAPPPRSEVDILYATAPGDAAFEVPLDVATKRYRGLFTDAVLNAVTSPREEWVETVEEGAAKLPVVTTRRLKPHLESVVADEAAAVDIKLRQQPEVHVETSFPKFFASVPAPVVMTRSLGEEPEPAPTRGGALLALRSRLLGADGKTARRDAALADELGLTAEIERLKKTRGMGHFETETGFTVVGAGDVRVDVGGTSAEAFSDRDDPSVTHVRVSLDDAGRPGASAVFSFAGGNGTVLAALRGFIGTVVVEDGRTVSVSYVPSDNTPQYGEYVKRAEELEDLKALVSVAARHGRFLVGDLDAADLAARIRVAKSIDPALGIYAAYAYAQAGRYEDAVSVYRYMSEDSPVVPFDVVMLARRAEPTAGEGASIVPFGPMLSQGWSLLMAGDSMHAQLHEELRSHLIPSLWTTFDADGIAIARDAVLSGAVA